MARIANGSEKVTERESYVLRDEPLENDKKEIRFIDLFCGIGGFHVAMDQACNGLGLESRAVFASDIDSECQRTYEANFGLPVNGDITKISAIDVPDHDVLLGGFPCQPFSIIGERKEFNDTRGIFLSTSFASLPPNDRRHQRCVTANYEPHS